MQDFFGQVLRLLSEGRSPAALLGELHEPNEIRLGFSHGRAQGRALGPELAGELAEALSRSQAIRTGLLSDLEDTILMIPNIGPDLISDITANVLRERLMDYTRDIAAEYLLDLTPGVHVGPIWNPHSHSWEQRFDEILIADGRPLVLVPKAVVRKRLDFDADEYYDHYIIPQLQSAELDAASELVQLLKNGRTRVTKKDVVGKYGRNKLVSERVTLENPHILDDYRREKTRSARPPLTHQGLADEESSELPDWDGLLAAVEAIAAGTEGATRYEFAIKDLLSALFYPALTYPRVQTPIHEGRKRIDITFTNMAQAGFFSWVKATTARRTCSSSARTTRVIPPTRSLINSRGASPRTGAVSASSSAGDWRTRGYSERGAATLPTTTGASSLPLMTPTSVNSLRQRRRAIPTPSYLISGLASTSW